MTSRDGAHTSLWQQTVTKTPLKVNALPQQADVIIVGAGITGITTGLMLQKAGKECIILEAQNIGFGTTGGTTAHINTLLDTPYSTIIKNFSSEDARLVARAAEEAVNHIRENVNQYNITCGFESCKAVVFAQNEEQDETLQSVLDGCNEAELDVIRENDIPIPIDFTRAFSAAGQAKFHPLRYIQALAQEFTNAGGSLLEHSRVVKVREENDVLYVETTNNTFAGRHIIYATHVPPGINLVHLRYTPYRSYAIAVKLASGKYPRELVYDLHDPYHYYRTQEIDGEQYLIVGGEDHKTGDDTNTQSSFMRLESHVRKYFDVESITHKWSSQYYESTDGLPYIGVLPGNSDKFLVATGFGGNGMTYGTLSAMVLKSLIFREENPLIKLFSPSRLKPVAGFKNFTVHNFDVLKEVMSRFFASDKINGLADIAPTEGKVIQIDDDKVGIYKDEHGSIHAVYATCTHMGCTVSWNQAELSWDCPCHGARYSVDGTVLNGPADRDLEYMNVELLEAAKP